APLSEAELEEWNMLEATVFNRRAKEEIKADQRHQRLTKQLGELRTVLDNPDSWQFDGALTTLAYMVAETERIYLDSFRGAGAEDARKLLLEIFAGRADLEADWLHQHNLLKSDWVQAPGLYFPYRMAPPKGLRSIVPPARPITSTVVGKTRPV